MDLKRYFTKYVRDRAKAKYDKGSCCDICGSTDQLDFHHFYSLAELVADWQQKNGLDIQTAEEAFKWRDKFIEEHHDELYVHAATLCREHHQKLHSIYGRNPPRYTAQKQERWVNIQREKHGHI